MKVENKSARILTVAGVKIVPTKTADIDPKSLSVKAKYAFEKWLDKGWLVKVSQPRRKKESAE